MSHPHSSREHIMNAYRRYVMSEKRNSANRGGNFRRGARSLIHYMDYVVEYLEAKRDVLAARKEK